MGLQQKKITNNVIRVPGEKKEGVAKNIFKEIMTKEILKAVRERNNTLIIGKKQLE